MANGDEEIGSEDSNVFRLPIHFDVESGRMPASDIEIALKSVDEIVQALEAAFGLCRGANKKPVVYVEGTKDGSFLIEIFIWFNELSESVENIRTVIYTIGVVTNSQQFRDFYHRLTGKEFDPDKYFDAFGSMLKGMLNKKTKEIEEITPNDINLEKCTKAKSDFYKMAFENPDVQGIDFDDSKKSHIRREDFRQHCSVPSKIRPPSRLEYRQAVIVAPLTVDSSKARKWGFINKADNSPFSAYMRDEDFRRGFLHEAKYPLKQTADDDEILALFEVKRVQAGGELVEKDWSVVEVLLFDGVLLEGKSLPSKEELLSAPPDIQPQNVLPLFNWSFDESEN
jgi:hypothetical protein